MAELTRGQLVAFTIKAHPEMDEAAIAQMIDNQIAAAIEAAHITVEGASKMCEPLHNFLEVFCAVPGCGLKRSGSSRYCKKHDMRARRGKDPAIDCRRGRPWKEQA